MNRALLSLQDTHDTFSSLTVDAARERQFIVDDGARLTFQRPTSSN